MRSLSSLSALFASVHGVLSTNTTEMVVEDPRGDDPIIGGEPMTEEQFVDEYRYLSMVGYFTDFPSIVGFVAQYCGSSVVGPNAILYAAHCNSVGFSSDDFFAVNVFDRLRLGGGFPMGAGDEPISRYNVFDDGTFYDHPDFNDATYEYDLALFILNEGMVVPDYIPFVKMNFERDFPDVGAEVQTMGWGTTFPDKTRLPSVPNIVTLDKIDTEVCQQIDTDDTDEECRQTPEEGLCYQNIKEDLNVCTLTPEKDACVNDSGGPLVYRNNGEDLLIGAVSWGPFPCANNVDPGVFASTYGGKDWITNMLVTKAGLDMVLSMIGAASDDPDSQYTKEQLCEAEAAVELGQISEAKGLSQGVKYSVKFTYNLLGCDSTPSDICNQLDVTKYYTDQYR